MRQDPTHGKPRTIRVVGGGLAGLIAALFAARQGAHVELYEAVRRLGGRAATREDQGFHLNMGPHGLYRTGPAQRILDELGVDVSGHPPDPRGSLAYRAGRLYALPVGPGSLLTTRLLSGADKLELARILAAIGPRPPAAASGHRLRAGLASPATCLADALREHVRRPRVREVLEALVRLTTYCHAPERICARDAFEQLELSLGGGSVRYLDGGWQRMVDALAARARALGVEIHTGLRIRQLAPRAGGWELSARELGTVRADAVVLALGPRDVAELVEAGTGSTLTDHAAQVAPVRAACLDVGLSALPRPANRFALGIDTPTYFSVHTPSAELAPEGGSVLHVARYLSPEEKPDRRVLLAELEGLLDLLQPGWRSHCVTQRLLSDARVAHAVPEARAGGRAERPRVHVTQHPGLYLAGDWVGDEGLLADAAFASGRAAGLAASRGEPADAA